MPVAARRKSWEDHVSRRPAPRYSYDDLDLVCCHEVRPDLPRWRRGRRERCASMPECCHPGVATFVSTEEVRQQEQGDETESSETALAEVFERGSVQDNDIVAEQIGCSLASPAAGSATELDGASGKPSPQSPAPLAKNPTTRQTAAADEPLDPTYDNNARSHGDDLEAPEAAGSDLPAARHPEVQADSEASSARHPDVLDAPRAPASAAQTTVAVGSADAAQKEDGTAKPLGPAAAFAPAAAAPPTAREEAPSPLSRPAQPSAFEEASVLKADMLQRVPSIEFAAGESGPEHKPNAADECQGHMTGEAQCCWERPGRGQTDLGRPASDIAGVDTAQEARGPEGLALAAASGVEGSSAAAAVATMQAAQSDSSSSEARSEGLSSAQRPLPVVVDRECIEGLGWKPCESATREGTSPELPVLAGSECSGSTDASQERRHEGGCGGPKLDTILEVFFSETGEEIGGGERQGQCQEDNETAVPPPSPGPREAGESSRPGGTVGVDSTSSNNMALERGADGHHSDKSLTSGCSGQPLLTQAEDFSSKMEAIEEEGVDGGRCESSLPALSQPAEQQDAASEETTVKLRVRKSSREEREHSRLDSMVLLIMKLDQLDQEIESALSSTSSKASTPTLRRKGLSEMDLGALSEAGSVSVSTQSLHSPLHRLSSSSSSTGPVGPSGARPKSGTLAVVSEKDKAEIEAKEACNWLRAAGFPQYAQLYEDGQFPIEISSVTRDHDFLDGDAIEALCRRLHTLNKCALMRLDVSPQRKRSDDSDEDEPCAISGRWTFQRDSKRWSRLDELDVFSPPGVTGEPPFPGEECLRQGMSTESVLTDLSEQPEVGSLHSGGSGGDRKDGGASERGGRLASGTPSSPGVGVSVSSTASVSGGGATRASSVGSVCSSATSGANEDSLSDGLPSPLEMRSFSFEVKSCGEGGGKSSNGGGSTSTRSRAKSFLKRMESLRLRSGTLTRRKKPRSKLEISGPVGIQEGLDEEKLRRLNCVDILPAHAQNHNQTQNGESGIGSSVVVSGGVGTHGRHRSVSYFTQTSSGSAGSSQSEGGSSGSAVSTPSPVTRARSHSTAAAGGSGSKRGGMYLEGFDPFSLLLQPPRHQEKHRHAAQNDKHNLNTVNRNLDLNKNQSNASRDNGVVAQNRRNSKKSTSASSSSKYDEDEAEEEEEEDEEGVIFFYLPEGHKPGTFPKALADGGQRRRGVESGASTIRRRPRRGSSASLDSRLSVYDNVPTSLSRGGGEEEEDERKLEDVLKDVSGLQRLVNAWTEAVVAGEEEEEVDEEDEEEEEEEEEEDGDSDSALDSASPCPSSPLQNQLEEENGSDQDSTGNPAGERQRRDSGVGASLTRANRPQKLRWPSFQSSHRPSLSSTLLQIGCQSVLQMNLLQKYSLLKLTALLEKHTPTNKHGFSWAVPKFMKRMKVRDYKDRSVFGVPLHVNVQRTGQPLPQSIQQAMRYLRSQCLDQVGLFRKSGVKSRIQALRQMNEACGADGGGVSYEGQSAYDVADMLKQYFRDLPEPLFTTKLSDTFLQIYQYMPKEQRLQAVRAAVLLLPDEAREALQTLLCFLSDVTASVADNQMTCTNLAVCLAPSLFHLNTLRRDSSSPRVMNRKQNLGKPDQRDLNENLAATHGLAHMIQECRKLFQIPEEMSRCRNSYVEQCLSPVRMEELTEGCGPQGYRSHLREALDALLKEAKDKFRGYDSVSTPEPAELAYKKVHDGSPLRLWKASVEVPAPAEEVLSRVLREQQRWDEDLLEGRVVESLEERAEVYQYVRNSMAPHPPRDHVVLRTWLTDLPKGACAVVSASVDHDRAAVMGVRANILTSRYYMEPCGQNKTRLTHISRVDCRGRFPEWYNKLYGHQCAAEVVRIRDSFTSPVDK